ncbi:MAG: hypothetical protein ACTSWL_05835, partial [Promethearchaeota archaeon]
RNFIIKNQNDEKIGYGYGSFLFFDIKERKAIPIPEEVLNYPTSDHIKLEHHFDLLSAQSEVLPENSHITDIKVNWGDIDLYQHVNNVKYISWMLDSVPQEILQTYQCFDIEIQYKKELRLGNLGKIYSQVLEEESGSLKINHLLKSNSTDKHPEREIAKLQTLWQKRNIKNQ